MRVPNSFKQITVEQFQEALPIWQSIQSTEDSEKIVFAWANIIAILTDKQTDEIESLPINELKEAINSLSWFNGGSQSGFVRKYLWINGRLHKAKLNAKHLNTAQYVELKTFLGRGTPAQELHNILATIYTPLTLKGFVHNGITHPERAAYFKKAKVGKVAPTVFFYSKALMRLIKSIQESGIKKAQKKIREAEALLLPILKESSGSIGAGTQPLTN